MAMATEKLPKREIAEAEKEMKRPLPRAENIEDRKRELPIPTRRLSGSPSIKRWTCNSCDKSFSSMAAVRGHAQVQKRKLGGDGDCTQRKNQCLEERSMAMATEKLPKRDIAEAEKEKKRPLPRAENIEDRKRELPIPTRRLSGSPSIKRWTCNSCDKSFSSMAAVRGHAQVHKRKLGGDGVTSAKSKAKKAVHQRLDLNNLSSHLDLAPEAVTNMPQPLNAEELKPNTEVPQDARAQSKPSTCGPAIENMTSLQRKPGELTSSGVVNMNESKWKKLKEGCCSLVRTIEEAESLPPEKAAEVDKLFKEFKENLLTLERLFQKTTALAKGCSRRSPLVTTELVGRGTHRKINEIYSSLMQENIFIIGVNGMGGVGKTAILMHVHNKLLEDHTFDEVLWVTVPWEFSTYALQEEIANAVGLHNLSNEKDVKRRASILYGHLKMKKSVLILDGLWMHFEVKDVGIPVEMGSVKLVFSTRSLDVCCEMLCQKQIKIELLDKEESWRLFLKALCFAGKLPSDVEEIAKFIVHKCEGLPLGIIEIATHMRGVEKVHEWKGMLQNFKDSRIELDVFKELKLSYMNLGDHQVQQCFLHLALCFGEDLSETNRERLIESFIDEGLLDRIATLQELHDQGNTILDKMRKACLLDDLEEEYLYLHPLTRYMALHIVTSTTQMVKAYMGLKEIPEEVFWTNCLERVFLQGNKIEEITYGVSPYCPKLTKLLLNDNDMLGNIHTSFFRNLKVLKNLDLSNTRITELAESVCHLDKLEVLLLRRCRALKFIPHVGKLGHLRKLDLQGCSSLDEVPEGMEMLVNLRYLDLDDTKIETLPEGVLGNLVNLQYLVIKKVRAGEGVKLKKLEALDCSVPDVETFNMCVRFLEQNSSQRYKLVMDAPYHCESDTQRRIFIDSCDHITASIDGTSGDGGALIPESVQSLGVSRCHKMKSVMGWEWMITHLSKLEEIIVYNCDELEEIMSGPLPSGATCFLTYLGVNGCKNMKRVLLTQDMLLDLPFLQEISVEDCKGIEVIIGTAANMTHSFPKLIHLGLWNLPELKSICDGIMSCNSLQWISIDNCPKLRRISLQLSLLDNGLPSPPPSLQEIRIDQQTWESLEWDNPLARDSLEHLVRGSWFD